MTNYNGRGWATETRPGDVGLDTPPTAAELTLNIYLKGLNNTTLFYPRELASLKGVDFRFGREGHIFATAELHGAYQVQAYLPGGRPTGFQPPTYDPGRYLALPKNLPPRIAELTKSITKDAASPYEEALAIEAYLRTFPYALDVPATPPGRDFADYYLFDLQRVYCAYSATAMAVMLRTVGISSRWVQGFVVEPGKRETEVPFGNAHAWVEAYFPGYGWATFDPTPRFALPARLGPAPQGEIRTVPVVEAPEVSAPREAATPPVKPQRHIPWGWLAAAIVGLAYVATSFRRFFRERIDWTDERAGLLRAFALLTGALRRMGLGRRPTQTPLEYAQAVGANWPELAPYLRDAAADATAARYARPGAPAPEGARRRMGEALAAVWRQAERRWGVIRTAWIRFRFFWGKD
jgi:transglutaminase-like putative cysteine protease